MSGQIDCLYLSFEFIFWMDFNFRMASKDKLDLIFCEIGDITLHDLQNGLGLVF